MEGERLAEARDPQEDAVPGDDVAVRVVEAVRDDADHHGLGVGEYSKHSLAQRRSLT